MATEEKTKLIGESRTIPRPHGLSTRKRYLIYKSQLVHFVFAAALIYLFVSNLELNETDIIGITSLGAASFAIAARIFSSLGDIVLNSQRVQDSMDYMQQWLPPELLTRVLPIAAEFVAKVCVGGSITVLLYVLDGIKLAVLPALNMTGAAFVLYLLLAFTFWFRLWRHLFKRALHPVIFSHVLGPNTYTRIAAMLALATRSLFHP